MNANTERRKIQVIRHEFAVKTPVDAKNLTFVLNQVWDWVPEDRRSFDDAFAVDVGDDEIVFHWTEERTTA